MAAPGFVATVGRGLKDLARWRVAWPVFLLASGAVFVLLSLGATYKYTYSWSVRNFDYLTEGTALLSASIAVLVGVVIASQVFSFAHIRDFSGGSTAAGVVGVLGALVSSLGCCGPLIPTLFSLLALGSAGAAQRFFASYESDILLFFLAVEAGACLFSLHGLGKACAGACKCESEGAGVRDKERAVERVPEKEVV